MDYKNTILVLFVFVYNYLCPPFLYTFVLFCMKLMHKN